MKSDFDLIIRAGNIVTPDGVQRLDVGIVDGRIAKLAPTVSGTFDDELDVSGRYVFPGIIDAHVHFNEPGRADWEGISTGSAALVAGGGTAFFDMPLNSEPPVLNAERLREKRALGEERSCTDFGIWGGLTPLNLDHLAALKDAGAIGLKAFMSSSGIESFPRVDERALREGMRPVATRSRSASRTPRRRGWRGRGARTPPSAPRESVRAATGGSAGKTA